MTSKDVSAHADGQDAFLLHGGENGLGARAAAGDLVDAPLQLVGGLIQDAPQLADLVAPAHGGAGGEVAGGDAARRPHHLRRSAAQD